MNRFALLFILILTFVLLVSFSCSDSDDDSSDTGSSNTDDDDDDNDDNNDDDNDDDDTVPPPTTSGYVYISAGQYSMGSPEDELGHRDNEALHDVTLTHHFEIKETEVKQEEFRDLLGYNPSRFPLFGRQLSRPVEQVSWYDALAYCNQFSEQEGYAPCYEMTNITCADETTGDDIDYCKANGGIVEATVTLADADSVYDCEGFRLPTEAEWEYAARAGTTTSTYNGDATEISCATIDPQLASISWYCANSHYQTQPVGLKTANNWGLYDVLGNVSEWCWDIYESDITGNTTNPEGATTGNFTVVRGGSYRFYGPTRIRAAYRAAHHPSYQSYLIGLRPVRTLPDEIAGPGFSPRDFTYKPIDLASSAKKSWPTELPFTFTRPDVGTPLTQQEIDDFTQAITSFWAESEFFEWLLRIGHGSTNENPSWPDFKMYWQGVSVIKNGSVVTFEHHGSADNLMTRNPKFIINAIAGYLASGDAAMGRVVKEYCKGVSALFKGFLYSDEDPEPDIMPRTVFPINHTYFEDGREAYVDYDPVKNYDFDWNGWTIPIDDNPYWGSIWVRTMRSKDDTEDIYRMVPLIQRAAAEITDPEIQSAAAEALDYLERFARDIVDTGYIIRSKDEQGNAFIPLMESGTVNDLASYVNYDFVSPNAECTAELGTALIGYGDPLGNNCGLGIGLLYEIVATHTHYFNARIIRMFHIAAITNALMWGENQLAKDMVNGLARRVDFLWQVPGQATIKDWDSDFASFLVMSASSGLPLTSREARLVMEEYTLAAQHYSNWAYWDLWDASVPDGSCPYGPDRSMDSTKGVVRIDQMLNLIEYCYTPFRNDATAPLVDCSIILDPTQWGQKSE